MDPITQKTQIEMEYIQKVADYLCGLKEATYVVIENLTETPDKFIEACKEASKTYCIDITFTPDYKKVKRERTWKNSFIN